MNSAIKKFTVFENSTIYNAIKSINRNTLKTLLVVKKNNIFAGTVTDGDIRRALIKGVNIKSKLINIYNRKSKYFLKIKLTKIKLRTYLQKTNTI